MATQELPITPSEEIKDGQVQETEIINETKDALPPSDPNKIAGINLQKLQDKLNILNTWKNQNSKSTIEQTMQFVRVNCGLSEDELIFVCLESQDQLAMIRRNILRLIGM